MMIVVGLGNPGEKYKKNRHNVGHQFIDSINKKLADPDFQLSKTNCYMNVSGPFIKQLIESRKLKIENLVVVHDDLDIPLGKFKIQFANGPKDHNGLLSIEEELGTNEFWRIRIGVDNRDAQNRINGEAYVLQDFTGDEEKILKELFPSILKRLDTI